MPISLDTFQRTLDTSKIQGFVKLSDTGASVKSYGGGFFARHFGLYSKPSAAENNAVRRAFYESVMDTYHCKGEVLANLRQELGIGENGASVSGRQLGVREAKEILQRVKVAMAEERTVAKDIDNGKPFDFTLKRAFQEAMCTSMQRTLDLADKSNKIPDIKKAFYGPLRDLHRLGTGLKLGDTIIARANDTTDSKVERARSQEMVEQIEQFFAADPINGMRAARIIGDTVHQGFMANIQESINLSHEPCDVFLNEDTKHIMDFKVSRSDDGSYKIGYEGVFDYRLMTSGNQMKVLDPSQSQVRFTVNMTLSFDAESGKPKIEFDQAPTMAGRLTPHEGVDMSALGKFQGLVDPTDGTDFEAPALLSGELSKPDFRAAIMQAESKEAATEMMRSRIITQSDKEILRMLNFNSTLVTSMMGRFAANETTPHLGKEIIGRLLDPATREAAVQDLKKMAQPIIDKGWSAPVGDIQPELMNLVTVAGLSNTSMAGGLSDAALVAKFIRESDNPDVKRIPLDLQSSNPATVAAAKEQVKALALTQRHELGLKLLCAYSSRFTEYQCEVLAKHIPADRCNDMLQHIVNRDSYFDDAFQFFNSNLDAAEIFEKEEEEARRRQEREMRNQGVKN